MNEENRRLVGAPVYNLLKKNKYYLGKFLGSGANGHAFVQKDDPTKVLKITIDDTEANACARLVGVELKNVAKIFEVYKLKISARTKYLIVQERLNEFSSQEEMYIDTLFYMWEDYDSIDIAKYKNFKQFWEHYLDFLSSKNIGRCAADAGMATEDFKKLLSSKKFLIIAEQLFNGLRELGKNKIKFYDYHAGNVLKDRQGNLKIIDLGVSVSPRVPMEILEAKRLNEWSNYHQKNFDLIEKILKRNKISLGDFIDSGAMGLAFKMANDPTKVVKITTDQSEARTSNIVKLKGLIKNILEIYNVYEFKHKELKDDYWVIIEEFLPHKLNSAEKDAVTHFGLFGPELILSRQPNTSFEDYAEYRKTEGVKRPWPYSNSPQLTPQSELAEKVWRDLFNGIKELNKIGIILYDYHFNNVLKNSQGDYVIIDLGISSAPASQIKVLEKRNYE